MVFYFSMWFFGFSHSSSCHPIGERFGLMKVKVAVGKTLSTGFFKKKIRKILGGEFAPCHLVFRECHHSGEGIKIDLRGI
jgi:hypothetical protein